MDKKLNVLIALSVVSLILMLFQTFPKINPMRSEAGWYQTIGCIQAAQEWSERYPSMGQQGYTATFNDCMKRPERYGVERDEVETTSGPIAN